MRPGFVRLRLFDWQDAVAVSDLRPDVKVFALTVGRYSKAMTGADVLIKHGKKAALLGVSEDTITRRVRALVTAGYLELVRKPAPDRPPMYVMTGPETFDRTQTTPGTTEPDRAERSHRTTERLDAERSRSEPEETNRTGTADGAEGSPVNAPQIPGSTHRTAERERADQKQVSNLYSSSSCKDEAVPAVTVAACAATSAPNDDAGELRGPTLGRHIWAETRAGR